MKVANTDNDLARGQQEISNFFPIRFELIALVQYWVKEALGCEYFQWLNGIAGGSETRWRLFAWGRVNRIGDLLGKEEVQKAVDKATTAFGQEKGDGVFWITFFNGGSVEDIANSEPQDADGYRVRAVANSCLMLPEDAIRDFSQVIKLKPTDPEIYFYRAQQFQEIDQQEAALNDLDRAIELDPKYRAALSRRANLRNQMGLLKESIKDWDSLIGYDPEIGRNYFFRARTLVLLGRDQEARRDFDLAAELGFQKDRPWTWWG